VVMYISDPGNDGRVRTMIPNGCTAVGARGCSADVRVVEPTNAVIAWTNAPRPWSLCHSRVHLTVLTTPRHFTANTIMVYIIYCILIRFLSFAQNIPSKDKANFSRCLLSLFFSVISTIKRIVYIHLLL